jgi:hypothetical protein
MDMMILKALGLGELYGRGISCRIEQIMGRVGKQEARQILQAN